MKYCQEIVDGICECLENMQGRVTAVENSPISYETFSQWMKNRPEFAEAVKKAEEKSYCKIKSKAILSIVDAFETSWQAAAWWLERKYKDEFAKQIEKQPETGIQITKETLKAFLSGVSGAKPDS